MVNDQGNAEAASPHRHPERSRGIPPLQTGKRWVFDDEKREVLSLPTRTPVVITRVQKRFLDFAFNDDTRKALFSEPRNLKAGIRDE